MLILNIVRLEQVGRYSYQFTGKLRQHGSVKHMCNTCNYCMAKHGFNTHNYCMAKHGFNTHNYCMVKHGFNTHNYCKAKHRNNTHMGCLGHLLNLTSLKKKHFSLEMIRNK